MEFFNMLPNEKIEEICYYLDDASLIRFVQTSHRGRNVCWHILENQRLEDELLTKIIEGKSVDEILTNPNLRIIRSDTLGNLVADVNEDRDLIVKILRYLISNKRIEINVAVFVEALENNLLDLIRFSLKSGAINPNDPKIFKNFGHHDFYFIDHTSIETIVDDPRITPQSKRKYEKYFLSSFGGSVDSSEFKQFNLYKYRFDPEDIRFVSSDLREFEFPDNLGIYISDWKEVYLKNIMNPNVEDIDVFLMLNPTSDELRTFVLRFDIASASQTDREELREILDEISDEQRIIIQSILGL